MKIDDKPSNPASQKSKSTPQKQAKKTADAKPQPATKPNRGRRSFPKFSIEECRKIPETLKQFNAGNPWSPKEVASSAKTGMGDNFFYLSAGARDYGFTIGTREAEKSNFLNLVDNSYIQNHLRKKHKPFKLLFAILIYSKMFMIITKGKIFLRFSISRIL